MEGHAVRHVHLLGTGHADRAGKSAGRAATPTPIEEYDNLYKKWNPDKFDAREWAKVVKDTGARYVVFLMKHHDGFCLWDTKQTDYNIMNGPFKRDVTKEFADACREQGIGFFPYYSTCDWHHPDFPVTSPGGKVKRPASNLDRYTDYLEAQVKELITGYGPLVGIWFDVPQCFDQARGERVIRFVRSLQPDILVNNRTGAPGDFDTPEQTVGALPVRPPLGKLHHARHAMDVETRRHAQALHRRHPHPRGLRRRRRQPRAEHQPHARRPDRTPASRELPQDRRRGSSKYGESIYGTRGGPFVAPGLEEARFNTDGDNFALPGGDWWGGSTHKGNAIYLHILRWPADTITLAGDQAAHRQAHASSPAAKRP